MKSGNILSPTLLLLLQNVLSIPDLLSLHVNYRISLSISTKQLVKTLTGLHWISRSSCEEVTSWQYWVFLFMNMKYLSIYWVLLWHLLSDSEVFLRSCTYFVKFISKYFILEGANVNINVFLILNFTCLFLIHKKAIEFLYINFVSCKLAIINYLQGCFVFVFY